LKTLKKENSEKIYKSIMKELFSDENFDFYNKYSKLDPKYRDSIKFLEKFISEVKDKNCSLLKLINELKNTNKEPVRKKRSSIRSIRRTRRSFKKRKSIRRKRLI
jgi:hypothetical protein